VTRTKTLLVALALLGTAASIAGFGTYATGYSSAGTSAGSSITTGVVTLGAGSANRLTTEVDDLQPGDTVYRPLDLVSSTTLLSAVTLSTTDTSSGTKLSANTVGLHDGLQLVVQWCSTAWTETGPSPAYTYTCGGTTTTLIASRDVVTSSPIDLGSGLSARNSGATLPTTDHLLVALTLPTASPSTAQTAQSIINYTFAGVQLSTPGKKR
jgi:hypothetical protein